jgi:replicative DNA helicase
MAVASEENIIGSILMRPEVLTTVKSELSLDDFTGYFTRAIYAVILDMENKHIPIDASTVVSQIPDDKTSSALLDLLESTTTSAAVDYHISQVKQTTYKRKMQGIANLIQDSLESGVSTDDILADVGDMVSQVKVGSEKTIIPILPSLTKTVSELEHKYSRGLKLGYYDFDKRSGGLRGGDIMIIAARPGMGKSVFAKDITEHVAAAAKPVLICSLEMSTREIQERQLSGAANINFSKIRAHDLNEQDWSSIMVAANKLGELPIFYVERGVGHVEDLDVVIQKARKQHDIRLVVVDYIQLLEAKGRYNSRELEVAAISRKLKCIARDNDIPIVCLAQLNRKCEERRDKRPILSDLRESGAIEQDADIVAFIYRDIEYNPHADPHES